MLFTAASKRRFCARSSASRPRKVGGALLDQLLEAAVELIELLDHQRHRAVGAAAVAVRLLVGCAHQLGEVSRSTLAGGRRRFGNLAGEEPVQCAHAASSRRRGDGHRLVVQLADAGGGVRRNLAVGVESDALATLGRARRLPPRLRRWCCWPISSRRPMQLTSERRCSPLRVLPHSGMPGVRPWRRRRRDGRNCRASAARPSPPARRRRRSASGSCGRSRGSCARCRGPAGAGSWMRSGNRRPVPGSPSASSSPR